MSEESKEIVQTTDQEIPKPERASDLEDFYGELLPPEKALRAREIERRARWKVDLTILPLLASVYFLAQMGRSDLGNAKIAGMDKELHLTPKMYSRTASLFLVGYLVFQLPGTLLLRKIGSPYQFGGAMILWGVITICTVKVTSYAGLAVTRVFMGAAEAFIQGCLLYLTFWYTYDELATRGAVFYSTSALAGSFNGLIAYAVQHHLQGVNGWSAWRWIFFIEGIIPVGWGFVIILLLPTLPETVRFGFSEEEKEILQKRSRATHNTGSSKVKPKLILKVLADPKFWLLSIIDAATQFCTSTVSNFLPDILHSFGWSTVKSQLMTVIVYACAFVGIILSARIADMIKRRGVVIVVTSSIAAVGYIILLAAKSDTARFVGTCIIGLGAFSNIVLSLTWLATVMVGYTYRASGAALVNILSTLISIAGNQAYDDPPYYKKGHGASLAMMILSAIIAAFMSWYLQSLNNQKEANKDRKEAQDLRILSVDDIGNKHPDFRFGL